MASINSLLSVEMLFAVSDPWSVPSLPSLTSVENPVTPLDFGLPSSAVMNDGG